MRNVRVLATDIPAGGSVAGEQLFATFRFSNIPETEYDAIATALENPEGLVVVVGENELMIGQPSSYVGQAIARLCDVDTGSAYDYAVVAERDGLRICG